MNLLGLWRFYSVSLGVAVSHSSAAPRYSLIGQSTFSRYSKVPPDRAPVALAHFAESEFRNFPGSKKKNLIFHFQIVWIWILKCIYFSFDFKR